MAWGILLISMLWSGTCLARLEVTGLYLNGREQEDPVDVEYREGKYLLALDDLVTLGRISPAEFPDGLLFDTPLGTTTLKLELLQQFDSKRYIALDDLATIGVRARFLRNYWAIALEIPWLPYLDREANERGGEKEVPKPDFPGPRIGLSSVGGQLHYNHDLDDDAGDVGATFSGFGPLAKGKWGVELDYDPDSEDEVRVSSLFWDRYQNNHALRLGTAVSQLGASVSGLGYTGIQYAYSNKGIGRHIYDTNTFTGSMLSTNSNYTQDIRGIGPPLGIAELRIDDRIIGRLQIGFDGRYEFLNLDLGSNFNRKIEIYIYEYSPAGAPVEVIDISKLRKPEGVSTGELFFQVGLGAEGNLLAESERINDEYGYFNLKYGLNNFVTAELGVAKPADSSQPDLYSGIIANLGQRMVLSTGLFREQDGEEHTAIAELFGEWDNFFFDYDGRLITSDATDRAEVRQILSLEYLFSQKITGVLKGGYVDNPENPEYNEQYLLPGAYWTPTKDLHFSLLPSSETYELTAYWYLPSYETSLSYRLSEDVQSVGSEHRLFDAVDIGLGVGQRFDLDEEYLYARLRYRPLFDPSQYLQANVEYTSEQTGFDLSWEKRLNSTTRLMLGYSCNYQNYHFTTPPDEAPGLTDVIDHAVFLTLSTTISQVGDSWQPGYSRGSAKRGAIIGSVRDQDGDPVSADYLGFRLDRRRMQTATTESGGYRLDNIPTGIHTLSLDNSKLPIEYVTNQERKFTVEVVPAGVTQVDLILERVFAVSGRLASEGVAMAGVWIAIRDSERVLARERTDRFGYYQFIGIPNGEYELQVNGETVRQVTVRDDFLFEVDIELDRGLVPGATDKRPSRA